MDKKKELYKPFKSKSVNKKYSVFVMKDGKKRLIHFGDSRYQQYRDKIGDYKHLDHNDKKRKDLYYKRHGSSNDRTSPKYYSHKYLW